ncbi:glycosyltransferase [Flavihumibacter sp. R14]|nr:glycosyltransferase [Flavihumibacter soli]
MCKITVITSVYNCSPFLEGYFRAVEKITNKHEIEILLMHNAPQQAEVVIISEYVERFPFIKHIIIPELEGLYTSWNKGIQLARGKYIAIWNTDDIRMPCSLSDQAIALDEDLDAAMSYGDFIIVGKYGDREGRPVMEPRFKDNSKAFLREHHIGCFPMWRKEIHKSVGYFDEQFRLVADLDFQIRVSLKYPLVKVNTMLGYYLENTPSNLSSNRKLQRMERTALNTRYSNFDLLHLPYLFGSLKKVKISKYKWYDAYHDIRSWSNGDARRVWSKLPLIFISISNLPLDTLRFIKYSLPKTYQNKIGRNLFSRF